MIIITEATKSKSKKQFHQGVGIGFFSATHGLFPLRRAFIVLSPLRDTWASQVALMVEKLPANAENREDAGDTSSVPGSGRSPRGGNGNPLQYSCLENPMDRAAWCATIHSHTKELDTTEQLNNSNRSVSSWICPFLKTFAISLEIYNQEEWEIICHI